MAEQPTSGETPTEPVVAAPVTPVPAVPAVDAPPVPAAVPPVEPTPAVTPPVEPAAVPPVDAVPEKYELKAGTDAVHPALIEAITPLFKEMGVTAKQGQALADVFEKHRQAMIPQVLARDLDLLRADPELGKLNFGRTQARVNDALAAFTTPQERAALTASGLANNPTLVRMFHRIGASMQEAPQTDAGPQVREKLPASSKLYGGKDLVTSAKTN